jgi:hypothetical protein
MDYLQAIRNRSRASVHSRASLTANSAQDPNRIAPPSHRHAAPSAPWPWVDIGDGKPESSTLGKLGSLSVQLSRSRPGAALQRRSPDTPTLQTRRLSMLDWIPSITFSELDGETGQEEQDMGRNLELPHRFGVCHLQMRCEPRRIFQQCPCDRLPGEAGRGDME